MDGKKRRENVKNPRAKANIFSILTFSWVLPTFWLGYKRDLITEDLYSPLPEHTSSFLSEKILKLWEEELDRSKKIKGNKNDMEETIQPSLLRVVLKCFGLRTMMYGIFAGIAQIFIGVSQPLLLGRLLRYYSSDTGSEVTETELYLYAMGIVLCSFLRIFAIHPFLMAITHMGMKIRIACCALIYRKSLKLSKTALRETTVGQAVNLLSNDVNRFDSSMIYLHYLWIGPLQAIISAYFMYVEIGYSALVGMAVLILILPLQGYLGKRTSDYRLRTAKRTDERVRLTNEIISGIQAIKMYTWEKPFGDLIERARKLEISVIRATSYVRAIVMSFMLFTSRFCMFATVLAYILLGNDVNAAKIFVLTAYFNILREPMMVYLPQAMTQGAETLVSIRRLQNFMMYDEMVTSSSTEDKGSQLGTVKLKKCSAKWLDRANNYTLRGIDLDVKAGQLIAIVGQVGSGKSSLLQAILREMPMASGDVKVSGKLSYASQDPWLFAGSVRQNILFGSKMDQRRYERVVEACQLKRDFSLFPYGDKTIVGERGVSLSGGQRARINLARAVYANADIYLMDDPLSAVDTHVGKRMFEDCIAGYLDGKTRILVTHQLQYLKNVDSIVVLKDGAVQAQGTYDELQTSGVDISRLLGSHEEENVNAEPKVAKSKNSDEKTDDVPSDGVPKEEAEIRSSGTIAGSVYADYVRAGGNWCVISTISALLLCTQLLASAVDFFISLWVDLEEENASTQEEGTTVEWDSILSRDLCIYIYSSLVIGTVVLALVRAFSLFHVCMRASKRLHDKMFRGVCRATMRFFNTNSSGRILNRFSKDMGAIDELLPSALIDTIQISLGLIGIIVVIGISNYWLMIPTVAVGVIFYYIRVVYLATSRSVKRLEGVTRSPVFAHLNATLQGLTTIRAFNAAEVLMTEFDHHQDLHSSAWFIYLGSTRLFVFWLDIFCVIYIALVTFSFLVLPNLGTTGGNVGLAITQSISLTGMFQWGMRQSAELENQMTSVERVLEFSVVDREPPLESLPENKPDPNWPTEGRVEFKGLSLRYDPNEPPVLKDLNFTIEPREKIGIVGRTGAGKSSLVSAVFRLAYLTGDIIIDGIGSGKLGLHDLRSKISIIPQEPFLFSGTLRRNLDPFDEYPDDSLWQALEEVELKETGLDSYVSEGGSNLSVGQRQLVCLARAIVRNNRILILDEATANVDPLTDELIQKTIREKFANCTVLTIAHRLNTVMDSDKVLVMDAGTVVEYDHPHILLQKEHGVLRGMVEQTGKSMARSLTLIAQKSYRHSS